MSMKQIAVCFVLWSTLAIFATASEFVPLGDLPGGGIGGTGIGVDALGMSVVGSSASTGGNASFLWTDASGIQSIAPTGFASAVSDDGTVVVGMATNPNTGFGEPFVWTPTVFLAVKPAHADAALQEASRGWAPSKLLVSIAAGVTLETIQSALPEGAAVIRVMPNTPCLIGRGACGYAAGEHATQEQAGLVGRLLSSVGYAAETPESLLDAVTGLSGSGPAFVYTFIEALADGGVRAGLPRQLAAELAARTVAGAAEMVLATGEHPAALRDAVASPGGTTITGLAELERRGLRAASIEAVLAATQRSAELGRSD